MDGQLHPLFILRTEVAGDDHARPVKMPPKKPTSTKTRLPVELTAASA